MNLSVPRSNASELLLYIWKIIDLPNISKKNLFYKISFELFLMTPEKATLFINKCIKSKLLIEDVEKSVYLTSSLEKKLNSWHENRFQKISSNLETTRKNMSVRKKIMENVKTNYGVLLKAFSDDTTLARAISISEDAFDITTFDLKAGKISAKVTGSQQGAYKIFIDTNEKIVYHDCHDFVTKRARNQKFCKHLTRLFLLLQERDEDSATDFLKDLGKNIKELSFTDNNN